jgi:hypothetical protein
MSERQNNLRKIWLIMLIVYLAAICWILPIYMREGYFELGEAKAKCYWLISLIALPAFGGLALALRRGRGENKGIFREKPVSEGLLVALILQNLLTFVFSVDKKTAFFGIEGWRCGLITVLLMLVYGLIFSWQSLGKSRVVQLMMLVVPFGEFILSILNRIGIYPLDIYGQNDSFLATIGNINWFSGYLSVFVPLGIGVMYSKTPFKKGFLISGVYSIVGLVALFLQGSDGAALILLATYGYMLWDALVSDERDNLKRFLIQLCVLGLAITIVDFALMAVGEAYTYEPNLLTGICANHVGLVILALAFFLYRLLLFFEEVKVPFAKKTYAVMVPIVYVVMIIGGIVWFVMNFNDSIGNGRGIIWRMSADMFMGLSPWQKLVGVGQDCFYAYAQQDAMWSASFSNVFGDAILTNAHCELLTMLIECGILGTTLYVGLFATILVTLFKEKEKERMTVAYALPIVSYFAFGFVTFIQPTSTPYAFLCIGMAIALIKRINHPSFTPSQEL